VIAVGAHLGPFTLLPRRLGAEGYRVNTIIEMANFPRLWKSINELQQSFGESAIPSKPISFSIKKSLSCLRRNEVLYIIADQQQKRGGIAVPFFGQMALTPPDLPSSHSKQELPFYPSSSSDKMEFAGHSASAGPSLWRGPLTKKKTSRH